MSEPITQLDFVCAVAANVPVAIPAEQVSAALAVNQTTSTSSLSLEALLGLSESNLPAQQRLTLTIGEQHSADITISSDMTLQTLAITDIHPLPPLLAARCELRGVSALAFTHNTLILLVDTDHFLSEVNTSL